MEECTLFRLAALLSWLKHLFFSWWLLNDRSVAYLMWDPIPCEGDPRLTGWYHHGTKRCFECSGLNMGRADYPDCSLADFHYISRVFLALRAHASIKKKVTCSLRLFYVLLWIWDINCHWQAACAIKIHRWQKIEVTAKFCVQKCVCIGKYPSHPMLFLFCFIKHLDTISMWETADNNSVCEYTFRKNHKQFQTFL